MGWSLPYFNYRRGLYLQCNLYVIYERTIAVLYVSYLMYMYVTDVLSIYLYFVDVNFVLFVHMTNKLTYGLIRLFQ